MRTKNLVQYGWLVEVTVDSAESMETILITVTVVVHQNDGPLYHNYVQQSRTVSGSIRRMESVEITKDEYTVIYCS